MRYSQATQAFLLREAREMLASARKDKAILFDDCLGRQEREESALPSQVLLFRDAFDNSSFPQGRHVNLSSFYLASGLRQKGIEVILSDLNICAQDKISRLKKTLKAHPRINIIGLSLYESFFEEARDFIAGLRKQTHAFIGVGGVMPTLTPEQVFAHLPGINFLIRGEADESLPRLAAILNGKNIHSSFSDEQKNKLLEIEGLIFHTPKLFVVSSLQKVNLLDNYDRLPWDFRLLERRDLQEGLPIFSSRGCFNRCFFCTTPGRGSLRLKSLAGLKGSLGAYQEYLKRQYGGRIPGHLYRLFFYDDDFLADPLRAAGFFSFIQGRKFKINFFQTGINSFFLREGNRYTRKINQALLRSISADIFAEQKRNIYIGTENFSDQELARLGKGYKFAQIEQVVTLLCRKKICQHHHLILSNQLTTLEDIFANLIKINIFRSKYGGYFNLLVPVIPYLVSLYPSASFRIASAAGRKKLLNIRNELSLPGYPEYNYPLVDNDIPADKAVRFIVPVLERLFLREKDYLKILEAARESLLTFSKRVEPSERKKIERVIRDYQVEPWKERLLN